MDKYLVKVSQVRYNRFFTLIRLRDYCIMGNSGGHDYIRLRFNMKIISDSHIPLVGSSWFFF